MKNFEKYEKEILDCAKSGWLMGLKNGVPCACNNIRCAECGFFKNQNEYCRYKRVKWLYEEYEEPIKLSRLEHEILKTAKEKGFVAIAKNKEYNNCFFLEWPENRKGIWVMNKKSPYVDNIGVIPSWFGCFRFIKFGEEEVYSIDELLKCEVIDK